jgi:DNA-binding transcriptional MocR family regulator
MTAFKNKFEWVRAFSACNSGLTSTQHHVALMLAEKMNVEGTCFVTHAQLAAATRMSERTVCAALTALADMEWIERTPGRVGRATTYCIARPGGWAPPAETAPPTRRRREPADQTDVDAARRYLASIYTETGIDAGRVADDSPTTRRLLGVLRRHLTHVRNAALDDKVRAVLVEGNLMSAKDPAAVTLNRYKRALRLYPEHRPSRVTEGNPAVHELVGQLVEAMSMPRPAKPAH